VPSSVPIQNIYYMLSYCSGILPEKHEVEVTGIDKTDLLDLFAEVLVKRLSVFVKKGFYKEYVPFEDNISTVRGKILFKQSIAQTSLIKAHLVCRYDEFSSNILHNQILKATIHLLINHSTLKKSLKESLKKINTYFHEIDLIQINDTSFEKIKIHRNNRNYQFMLEICRIIHNYTLIDEQTGTLSFMDFERDRRMHEVFESFVRNFYRMEQNEFRVYRETINWEIGKVSKGDRALIPKMQTDMCLVKKNRKIIIDTKFYQKVLEKNYHGQDKIISSNLFQIYSYLTNADKREIMEGILLYPQTDREIDMEFEMNEYTIKIMTINLEQHWSGVKEKLLSIIK